MKISKRRVEYSHLEGNLRLVSMTDEERKELAKQHNTEKMGNLSQPLFC